jgi:hypothetical protein
LKISALLSHQKKGARTAAIASRELIKKICKKRTGKRGKTKKNKKEKHGL